MIQAVDRTAARKRLTVHALQTAAAQDIIGTAFSTMSPTVRSGWFPISKKLAKRLGIRFDEARGVPKPFFPWGDTEYAAHSFNTACVINVLRELSAVYPYQPAHILEAAQSVGALATRQDLDWGIGENRITNQKQRPDQDAGLALSMGVAVGAYGAVSGITVDVLRGLTLASCAALGMGSTKARTAVAIAYLCWSLSETGYLCSEDVEALCALKLVSEPLEEVLLHYAVEMVHGRGFWTKFDPATLPVLSYSERVLAEALWYMGRIQTQYKDPSISYTTVAKECNTEIHRDLVYGADVAFVFAAICIYSEQVGEDGLYKLVIPDSLVEGSPRADEIKNLIEDL